VHILISRQQLCDNSHSTGQTTSPDCGKLFGDCFWEVAGWLARLVLCQIKWAKFWSRNLSALTDVESDSKNFDKRNYINEFPHAAGIRPMSMAALFEGIADGTLSFILVSEPFSAHADFEKVSRI